PVFESVQVPQPEPQPVEETVTPIAVPPIIPPIILTQEAPSAIEPAAPGPEVFPQPAEPISAPPVIATVFASESSAPPPPPPPKRPAEKSFEMRLGTVWLVRIGVVMVLTALVFFANLAYHTFISKLGPGGKVALLYVASGLLLGAGS